MSQKCCPRCNSSYRRRKKKTGYLKLLPFNKYYRCGICYASYIWSNTLNTGFMIESGVLDSEEHFLSN